MHRLSAEQIEEIGEEFQKIHDEVYADLGERDAVYIRSIISFTGASVRSLASC